MPRALLSVSNKDGLIPFARGLVQRGFELVSTGGTFKALRDAGLPAVYVSEITGFPEILEGRVKTLHPNVHGGILAKRTPEHLEQLEQHGITPIDLVCVNLYPFRQTIARQGVTLEEALENIDIGGPSMVRGAAKNYAAVLVVVDPEDYDPALGQLGQLEQGVSPTLEFRKTLAQKAFAHTAEYDTAIALYLLEVGATGQSPLPQNLTLELEKVEDLRYGENPHQKAALYREKGRGGALLEAEILQGKAMSFNNYTDAQAAWNLLLEFTEPTCIGVKHANPCAVGTGENLLEAWTRAYAADPVSIFGGIVALNRTLDGDTARALKDVFLEVILAPEFSIEALEVLKTKKNLRLLKVHSSKAQSAELDFKQLEGGFVVQQRDALGLEGVHETVVTERTPSEQELTDLRFAWRVVKHVKSNAIVVAQDGRTTGIGVGQVSRIWAAQQALEHAGEFAVGSVMASDAFLPFDDVVMACARAGITAVIQPGGSVRDEDSVQAANEAGIAMVFTGVRHFRH